MWRKAMDLVDVVYDIADAFPAKENYGLYIQLTRAVVSVPVNIAEGHARSTRKDFANFLSIAWSSLMETETLLTVAARRNYMSPDKADHALSRVEEISKMLASLRNRIIGRRKES